MSLSFFIVVFVLRLNLSLFLPFFFHTLWLPYSFILTTLPPMLSCQLKYFFPFLSWVRHSKWISVLPHFLCFFLSSLSDPLACLLLPLSFTFVPFIYIYIPLSPGDHSFIGLSQKGVKEPNSLCRFYLWLLGNLVYYDQAAISFFTTLFFHVIKPQLRQQ